MLVRHGQSVGNVADQQAREAGATRLDLDIRDPDVPLTDLGRSQAQALGRWLGGLPEPPELVLCSPYARAAATAELALRAAGLDVPAVRDERLRERDLGVLDGLTGAGIREAMPQEAERRTHLGKFFYRPPGGESWADVALRVRSLRRDLWGTCADRRVLLVSHQAVIMSWRYVLEDMDEAQVLAIDKAEPMANCGITTYAADGRSVRLRRYNQTAPIDEETRVTAEPDASARVV